VADAAVRVLLVDDHAVVREGLRAFLQLQEDIDVVGEAGDGEAAVGLARDLRPDVVLMDLVMPGGGGIAAISALRDAVPAARVLVLSSYVDEAQVFSAVQAGAAGYLLKDIEPDALATSTPAAPRFTPRPPPA
jgi:DNA-binding NarL/FixJ family response regulator